MIDLEKAKYLYNKAIEDKDNIKPIYNSILELTDAFQTIKDEGKTEIGSMREVDSDVISAIDTLGSYIMSSILPKQSQWADLDVDDLKMREIFGDQAQKNIDEIKNVLQSDVERTFRYIQASNYYVEVSKAISDFIKVGTGCYTIRETGIVSRPFVFQYVGLDNLFIYNDNFSKPNIIFKKHSDVNGEYLKDVFGDNISLKDVASEEDYKKETTVLECVLPTYNEETGLTVYDYFVVNEAFDTLLLEKQLEYNPFIVFHWSTVAGTSWGSSIVLSQINLLKELAEYKSIFKTQAKRIANPPAIFYGNQELFYNLSFDEGVLNYGGNPQLDNFQSNLQVIGGNGNLMPLDTNINNLIRQFKESIMVSHLSMNMQDTKYNTAAAVMELHSLFRKRFANTYELINSELIQPTFLNPFIIMLKIGALNLTQEVLPYIAVRYVNELTKADNISKVNRLLNYLQTAQQVGVLNESGVMLNLSKTLPYIQDMMEIPHELVPSESEILEYQEVKKQAMMEQLQAQAMVQDQGGDMNDANG